MMTRLTADCVVLGVVLCSRAATCEDPGARTRPDTDYCSTAVLTTVLWVLWYCIISARFLPADRRFGLLGGPILLRGTKQATGRPAPWEAEALLAGARVCWEAVTASREAPALERPREARRQAPLLGGLKRLAAG